MTDLAPHRLAGLPDPADRPDLYDDVPMKRLLAWVVDTALVWGVWVLVTVLTLGLAVFLLPLFAVIDFVYRWTTISRRSATWGMRLAAIELRDRRGERLDGGQALAHTAGYMASWVLFPAQVLSMGAMLATGRRQGLTDLVLGTAAVNRAD